MKIKYIKKAEETELETRRDEKSGSKSKQRKKMSGRRSRHRTPTDR